MADYYTLLTNAGIAYETACKAAGLPIKLSQISVGDGGGTVYNPAATATALKREVWRGPLNALFQDDKNPSWLLAEVTIPPDVGGWYVREAGLWTDTGILYAIVKYPESFKPVLATSGSGKEFYIRSIFETSNAALVTLLIDDTVVKATRAWVMSYLAEELGKLDGKQSVRVATTANVVLSGAQQIDGVAAVAGDRVLLASQTSAKDNGLWVVGNGAWTRAADANTSAKVTSGLTVMVEEGTANGDSLWHLVTNGPVTLGTTALSFEMLAGRTGIQAGTYKSLTVDKYGRVITGTNPETLAGFGITDTYTKPEIEAMIAQASALPVGTMVAFPVNKIAPGFLEIDGSVKSIAAYPDLATFLGTVFNTGDEGAGNFRLPESRGEFLRGWDHGRGADAGRAIGSYQLDALQNITGFMNASNGVQVGGTAAGAFNVNVNGAVSLPAGAAATGCISMTFDASRVARTAAETRGRNLSVVWCIKAWNAPINQGNIDIAALAALIESFSDNGPIVGSMSGDRMSVTAASSAATMKVGFVVVGDANGKTRTLRNFNQLIDLASATKGLGAMDAGAAPVSGWVALYALYNPDTKLHGITAFNCTSAVAPAIYGGAALPGGYTFSGLIGLWPTNASGQFPVGYQEDRVFSWNGKQVLDVTVNQASYTPFTVVNAVPMNAKLCQGYAVLQNAQAAANSYSALGGGSGVGGVGIASNPSGAVNGGVQQPFPFLPLTTAQTLYYLLSATTGVARFIVTITSYKF